MTHWVDLADGRRIEVPVGIDTLQVIGRETSVVARAWSNHSASRLREGVEEVPLELEPVAADEIAAAVMEHAGAAVGIEVVHADAYRALRGRLFILETIS